MKESKIGPLLLLLLCVLSPRNNSAHPNPSHDGVTNDGNTPTSQFDAAILKFQEDISNLPSSIAINREKILYLLIKSQDHIAKRRSIPIDAGKELSLICDTLIDMYTRNTVNFRIINHTARMFFVLANIFNNSITIELNQTEALFKVLSDAESLINSQVSSLSGLKSNTLITKISPANKDSFTDKWSTERDSINPIINIDELSKVLASIEAKLSELCPALITDEFSDIKPLLPCECLSMGAFITLVSNAFSAMSTSTESKLPAAISSPASLLKENIPVLESGRTIISYIVNVKNDLENDKLLLEACQLSLARTAMDQKDTITRDDISYNSNGIIDSLTALKKAYDNYANHQVPGILRSRGS